MANQEKTTAAGSMTVSGMPELAELKGDVLLPVVSGKNYKAKLSALKTFINQGMVAQVEGKGLSTNDYSTEDKQKLTALPTNVQLTGSLNNKLDKSVWDERNAQFAFKGYRKISTGELVTDPSYFNSGFIPLNHKLPLIYNNNNAGGNAANICFYNSEKTFIKGITGSGLNSNFKEVIIENFPENAAYFVVNTTATQSKQSYYKNGETFEARENAVSDAIEKSKLALFVDMWNNACGTYGKYNVQTGFFELNGLTDITYDEALLIYNAGIPQTMSCNWFYRANTEIRANLPSVFKGNTRTPLRLFENCTKLEVAYCSYYNLTDSMFSGCKKLRVIKGSLYNDSSNSNSNAFCGCVALESIEGPTMFTKDLDLRDCPLLTKETFVKIIAAKNNTQASTITVHPDVYAKLFNDEVAEYVPANLLLGSDVPITTSAYQIKRYQLGNIKPKQGDKVSLTIWGELPEDRTSFMITNSSGNTTIGHIKKDNTIKQGVYKLYFHWGSENNGILIYNYPSETTLSASAIEKIKLEFGENDNPVWSPAIEEIEDAELREKAEWAALVAQAEAKQIQFVTTE